MFFKRLLRSSGGKMGNFWKLVLAQDWLCLVLSFKDLVRGQKVTLQRSWGADGWALFGKGQRMKLHR